MTLVISYVRSSEREAAAAAGTLYSLEMRNQSTENLIFFVYQKLPHPTESIFSLAWLVSPYVIVVDNSIFFEWQITYEFAWSDTGSLMPGTIFRINGSKPADPNGANQTTFSFDPGPHLSDPVIGGSSDSLSIISASDVPSNEFSVGIGMSGIATFAMQAEPKLTYMIAPEQTYWVAAATQMKVGTALDTQTIFPTAEAPFGPGVNNLIATLEPDQTWTIQNASN